jgi:hypothetical protein
MSNEEWSPDEALGTESFRQGDVAEDEEERLNPAFREAIELDPTIDPVLVADELELEELGARLDDPERIALLEGGMDDPDGIGPPPGEPLREGDVGWDLSEPLVDGPEGEFAADAAEERAAESAEERATESAEERATESAAET